VVLYSTTGNAWPNPAVITITFVPDGTNLGGVTSNLVSSFNSKAALAGRWQTQILQAAQSWAQQTNINFVVVPDDGAPSTSGTDEQGDPSHGDIRIGGYNFGNSSLGSAYQPPPANNFAIAGDINFNTGMTFNIGTTYDLFTVAAHEFGHALGMDHTSSGSAAIMWPSYTGKKVGPTADDAAGIRSIYSGGAPRSLDAYYSAGANNSFATAANLNNLIGGTMAPAMAPTASSTTTSPAVADSPMTLASTTTVQAVADSSMTFASTTTVQAVAALVPNLDITTAGQADVFTFNAPANTNGTLIVSAQSQGLSLLSPKLTVYSASGAVLATASGGGQYGTTITVSVAGVNPSDQFYVKVQGADTTAFGTGRFALGFTFDGSTPPVEASPIVAIPNGNPLQMGGGTPDKANDFFSAGAPNITGITPDTGLSNNDGVTSATRISVLGTAPQGDAISVFCDGQFVGTTTADTQNSWTFDNTSMSLISGTHNFTASAADPTGNVSPLSAPYQVTVDTVPPPTPVIKGVAPFLSNFGSFGAFVASSNPTIFGKATAGTTVNLNSGNRSLGSVVADRNGDWNFTIPGAGLATGFNTVTSTATDSAGNTSSATMAYSLFVVNASGYFPTVSANSTVTSATAAVTSIVSQVGSLLSLGSSPTFTGTAAGNTDVALLEDGVIVGVASVNWLGHWTITTQNLSKGTHVISFELFDQYGDHGSACDSISIQV
jgi:hypothetical protein